MTRLNEAKRADVAAAAAVKQRRVDLAAANDTERRRRSGCVGPRVSKAPQTSYKRTYHYC